MGILVDGGDHEKNKGDQAWGVDAEGKGCYVSSSRLNREPAGLPGVKEIADENGQGGAGQNLAGNEFGREAAKELAETADQHELKQVVDEEPKKTVQVAPGEPGESPAGNILFAMGEKSQKVRPFFDHQRFLEDVH